MRPLVTSLQGQSAEGVQKIEEIVDITVQEIKYSIKDLLSKWDQIRRKL